MQTIDLIDTKGNITAHYVHPDKPDRTRCGRRIEASQEAIGNGLCRTCERLAEHDARKRLAEVTERNRGADDHLNVDHEGEPVIPLIVHGKQGDDLARIAEHHGSVEQALRAWAKRLRESAADLETLADLIEQSGETPHVAAGAGCAELGGVSAQLAILAEQSCSIVPRSTWHPAH